jgi:hypothetical protein
MLISTESFSFNSQSESSVENPLAALSNSAVSLQTGAVRQAAANGWEKAFAAIHTFFRRFICNLICGEISRVFFDGAN